MTEKTRGGPRRRINAPRDASEAHQLIAQLKAQFEITDIEDQLQALIEAQQERHETQMDAWLRQVFGLAMAQAGLTTLMVARSALDDHAGQPRVRFQNEGADIRVTLTTGV